MFSGSLITYSQVNLSRLYNFMNVGEHGYMYRYEMVFHYLPRFVNSHLNPPNSNIASFCLCQGKHI